MSISDEIRDWQKNIFVATLKEMGITEGNKVADFGCGVGNYTFAVSAVVGAEGTVYAIDRNRNVLESVRSEADRRNVNNIIPCSPDSDGILPIEDEVADMLMIYDLIHDLGRERRHVLNECRRILKAGAILSIAPFHMGEREIQKCIKDVEESGFASDRVFKDSALHFEMHRYFYNPNETLKDYEKGNIYNFIKK